MAKKVIQIIVRGGCIEDIRSDFPTKDYTVKVIDYDNEPRKKAKLLKNSLLWGR